MADVQELNINNKTYDIKAKSVVNQNGGYIKFWTGTQAEYEALPREWYAWEHSWTHETIYTTVPYDTSINAPDVYDSNFDLIEPSEYEDNYFYQDKIYFCVKTSGTCYHGTRILDKDIMTGEAADTIYICKDNGYIYFGAKLISPIWG